MNYLGFNFTMSPDLPEGTVFAFNQIAIDKVTELSRLLGIRTGLSTALIHVGHSISALRGPGDAYLPPLRHRTKFAQAIRRVEDMERLQASLKQQLAETHRYIENATKEIQNHVVMVKSHTHRL